MSRLGHILFLTQTAYPLGGVENWLEYLVPGLEQHGWQVTVGLTQGLRHHDPDRYLASHPYPRTLRVSAPTGTEEGRVRAVTRAIAQDAFDVVVPVNVSDMLEAARRVKATRRPLRILYPLHGDLPSYLADVERYRGVVDYAVATNRRGCLALQQLGGLSRERTAHVRYGSPPALATPRLDAASDVLRLAHVGRLTQDQKRVRELPALCAALDRRAVRYHLDIAGGGDEEPFLRRELSPQVAAGRATFHGVLTADQLYQRIYPGLTALVLLSDWETGPIVAWEAMQHGATVVTTCYRGLTTEGLLVPEVNALVSPVGDVELLAANIERLTSAEFALGLRREALRTAAEHCSIEASIAGWHQAFATCLAMPVAVDLPPPRLAPAAGRLDRWLGVPPAETVRALLGLGMQHEVPAGEWPHALVWPERDRAEFTQRWEDFNAAQDGLAAGTCQTAAEAAAMTDRT